MQKRMARMTVSVYSSCLIQFVEFYDWRPGIDRLFCCPKLQGICCCVRKYRSFTICYLQKRL